jgi:hypothetical protein
MSIGTLEFITTLIKVAHHHLMGHPHLHPCHPIILSPMDPIQDPHPTDLYLLYLPVPHTIIHTTHHLILHMPHLVTLVFAGH